MRVRVDIMQRVYFVWIFLRHLLTCVFLVRNLAYKRLRICNDWWIFIKFIERIIRFFSRFWFYLCLCFNRFLKSTKIIEIVIWLICNFLLRWWLWWCWLFESSEITKLVFWLLWYFRLHWSLCWYWLFKSSKITKDVFLLCFWFYWWFCLLCLFESVKII